MASSWGRWLTRAALASGMVLPAASGTAAAQEAKGTITIVKEAIPERYQDFRFTTGDDFGPEVPRHFTLDDDNLPPRPDTQVFPGLAAGTYAITEVGTQGWELVDVDCGGSAAADRSGATVTITITDQAESVTCTFVNRKVVHSNVEVPPPAPKSEAPAPLPSGSSLPVVESGPGQPQQGLIANVQGEAMPAADTPAAAAQAARDLRVLPLTGPSTVRWSLAGLALVAAGGTLLAADRRRSRRRRDAAPDGAS